MMYGELDCFIYRVNINKKVAVFLKCSVKASNKFMQKIGTLVDDKISWYQGEIE
jgi:hypothetical protein